MLDEKIEGQLGVTFTIKEGHDAFKEMRPLKALRPDGFHALFLQCYWNLVGAEVCDVVSKALKGEALPEGLNYSFIN